MVPVLLRRMLGYKSPGPCDDDAEAGGSGDLAGAEVGGEGPATGIATQEVPPASQKTGKFARHHAEPRGFHTRLNPKFRKSFSFTVANSVTP